MTDAPKYEPSEEAVEAVAKLIHDADDMADTTWPENDDDDGHRGGDGYVRLCQNPETFRAAARSALAFIAPKIIAQAKAEEREACEARVKTLELALHDALTFVAEERENREGAGGDETDYLGEARRIEHVIVAAIQGVDESEDDEEGQDNV